MCLFFFLVCIWASLWLCCFSVPKSVMLDIRFPFPLALHIHDFLWFITSSQDFCMLFALKLVSFQRVCLSLLTGTLPSPQDLVSVWWQQGSVGVLVIAVIEKNSFTVCLVFFFSLSSQCPCQARVLFTLHWTKSGWCTLTLRTVWIQPHSRGLKATLYWVHPIGGNRHVFGLSAPSLGRH